MAKLDYGLMWLFDRLRLFASARDRNLLRVPLDLPVFGVSSFFARVIVPMEQASVGSI